MGAPNWLLQVAGFLMFVGCVGAIFFIGYLIGRAHGRFNECRVGDRRKPKV